MNIRITTSVLALGAAGFVASSALALDPPDLSWSTIDGGGTFSTSNSSLAMSATLGQPDVGGLSGGDLTLMGGFWSVLPDSGYCLADWDGNGVVEPADVAGFINSWFTDLVNATIVADLDANGVIEPADVALFITSWFQTLSNGGC